MTNEKISPSAPEDERLLTSKEIGRIIDGISKEDWSPLNLVNSIAKAQLAKDKKHYGNRVEESKVNSLEAGKLLGAKEERERARKVFAIEYKKAIEEANAEPFPTINLNKEHKTLWLGHANAYSEAISWLDRQALKG